MFTEHKGEGIARLCCYCGVGSVHGVFTTKAGLLLVLPCPNAQLLQTASTALRVNNRPSPAACTNAHTHLHTQGVTQVLL